MKILTSEIIILFFFFFFIHACGEKLVTFLPLMQSIFSLIVLCVVEMSELLFECYHVPSVLYGVDSLFSLYKNHPTPGIYEILFV